MCFACIACAHERARLWYSVTKRRRPIVRYLILDAQRAAGCCRADKSGEFLLKQVIWLNKKSTLNAQWWPPPPLPLRLYIITIFISTLAVFVFSLSTTYLNKIITIIPPYSLSVCCSRAAFLVCAYFIYINVHTPSVISFFSDAASARPMVWKCSWLNSVIDSAASIKNTMESLSQLTTGALSALTADDGREMSINIKGHTHVLFWFGMCWCVCALIGHTRFLCSFTARPAAAPSKGKNSMVCHFCVFQMGSGDDWFQVHLISLSSNEPC